MVTDRGSNLWKARKAAMFGSADVARRVLARLVSFPVFGSKKRAPIGGPKEGEAVQKPVAV
jgi:hypothetical protein